MSVPVPNELDARPFKSLGIRSEPETIYGGSLLSCLHIEKFEQYDIVGKIGEVRISVVHSNTMKCLFREKVTRCRLHHGLCFLGREQPSSVTISLNASRLEGCYSLGAFARCEGFGCRKVPGCGSLSTS